MATRRLRLPFVLMALAVVAPATPAAAQQTVSEVLSFLLTNRSQSRLTPSE